jgi:hypothetical protein
VLVAGCVALVAAALIIVASFLNTRTLGLITADIPSNSYVSGGQWWVLAAGVVAGVSALSALFGVPRNSIGPILLASAAAVVAGILSFGHGYRTLTINPQYQAALGQSTVQTRVGIGVYLALAGGIIGLLAGVMLWSAHAKTRV